MWYLFVVGNSMGGGVGESLVHSSFVSKCVVVSEKFSQFYIYYWLRLDSLALNERVIAFETCSFTIIWIQSFVYKCDYWLKFCQFQWVFATKLLYEWSVWKVGISSIWSNSHNSNRCIRFNVAYSRRFFCAYWKSTSNQFRWKSVRKPKQLTCYSFQKLKF